MTYDDLGPWLTFSFSLEDGTLAALVREVENAPHPGYILTAISDRPSSQILERFISEAGIDSESVLHASDE
ncbi:hypothetical protein [Streptomyces sp. NPDC051214]|uniref:hypothetical protein n=1 Tax=Streptomyces sp. NPDC051214 TaxID=3155282 RepID=UPI003440E03D